MIALERNGISRDTTIDQGIEDLKLLCVPTRDPRQETVKNYSDIHPHRLREIEQFFAIYKDLEGKETETRGWLSAHAAQQAIRTASERFKVSSQSQCRIVERATDY